MKAESIRKGAGVNFCTKTINAALRAGLCAAILAGCSGGAGDGTSALATGSRAQPLVVGQRATKAGMGRVAFTIGIKSKAKAGRITPKYVSPSTQSLQILTDGTNPVVVNLTPSSPNCSPDASIPPATICTASLSAPAGNHIFSVTTYDLTDAKGRVLSANTTGTVYVQPIVQTKVPLVLEGVVQYVVLALATTNPPIDSVATIGLTAVLEDADQNLIIGPALYMHPVTLTTTDPSNGSLSKTLLNSPADVSGISTQYSGAAVGNITYSATASGLSVANVIPTVLTPGAQAQHLYLTNNDFPNSLRVFDLDNPSAAPTTITGAGYFPSGLVLDPAGKLYVSTSEFGNAVLVFDTLHGNVELPEITGGGLDWPSGVTVGSDGKLYVANRFDRVPFSVSIFDTTHGNAVLPPITGGGLYYPNALIVDAGGKLYVSNANDSISVFDTKHSNMALPPITGGGLSFPIGMAIDKAGKLYVANDRSSTVAVFDTAHGNAALAQFPGGGFGAALDAQGRLYTADWYNNEIEVFDTLHGNARLPNFAGAFYEPSALAVH
jgi:DNA-binding beta-propeller fold protein YncE